MITRNMLRHVGRIRLFLLLLASSSVAFGQSQTGQVSGVVVDQTGGVIAGATVQLIHDLTKNTREFATEVNGAFVFPNLIPGEYSIKIQVSGFKTFGQSKIVVSQSERVDLHRIVLEVGGITDIVEVAADAARVQTASSERAGLISPTMVETLPNRGRDYLGLLRSLPGVFDNSARNAPGDTGAPQVNGGAAGQFLVTLDGVPNQDVGCTNCAGFITPSVDAIGEVKVMLSGSQAEYGARSGGQMSVAIKNGTSSFHGSGYYFWRHEQFNANDFNNNLHNVSKPKYRYANPGYTIGGPIIIPGTGFNKNRDKLFFFFSHDILRRSSSTVSQLTFPTAAERNGDFSQSYDGTTNKVITLKDPTTGATIADGHLPSSLQSAAGLKLLNLFPSPNTTDPSGRHGYNAQYVLPVDNPSNNEILRVDWNVAKKTIAYVRFIRDFKGTEGNCPIYLVCFDSGFGAGTKWPRLDGGYNVTSNGVVGTVVHTFAPKLVNEFSYGINSHDQIASYNADQLKAFTRSATGITQSLLPAFFRANALDVVPNLRFGQSNGGGNIPNAAALAFDNRFPFHGTEKVQTIWDNLSYVKGVHNLKFGIYMEHTARFTTRGAGSGGAGVGLGVFNGAFDFGSDPFNGYDTGWGFANALAGVVKQYEESNRQGVGNSVYNRYEWFAQDNWKVSRRLTVDIGMRFTISQPANSVDQPLALFMPSTYSASANPALIMPACKTGTTCPSGANRIAKDPTTGQLLPQTLIGALSNASGKPYQAGQIFQGSYYNTPPIGVSPRFGFAWDVLGNGKLAVRGGFDILYDTSSGSVDDVLTLTDVPPATLTSTLNYTTLAGMQTAPNYYRVSNFTAGMQDFKIPSTYDWHFGVQRDMGFGIVLDMSYIGNTTRHQATTIDLNAVAPGTTWSGSTFTDYRDYKPAVLDSTNNQPLPPNFLRPYKGYGTINYRQWNGNSNYNAMQMSLTRRFGARLTFGGNWTWSRTLTYSKIPFYPDKLSYSPGNTRTHNMNVNWNYRIPNGSRFMENAATKMALNGWQFAGIFTAYSGSSNAVSYSVTGVPSGFNFSGSPTTGLSRIDVVSSSVFTTPKDSTDSGLNPAAFAIPALSKAGLGNAPPVLFWGPGYWNFDMSLFKNFALSKDTNRALEFRVETYNTFNHHNLGNPNTAFQTAWNNGNFGPNNNIYFGNYVASNGNVATQGANRVMVLAAKIRF